MIGKVSKKSLLESTRLEVTICGSIILQWRDMSLILMMKIHFCKVLILVGNNVLLIEQA